MASLEQRPRGDGGITARVFWRQDRQRTTEKFAPNSPDHLVFTTATSSTSSASLRWTGGRRPTQS